MTLRRLQDGSRGTLVVYKLSEIVDDAIRAAAPGYRIYNETLASMQGAYADPSPIPDDAPRPLYLAGHSEGAIGVRTQLARGVDAAGVFVSDGIQAGRPPSPAEIEPWRAYLARAASREVVAKVSHTSLTGTTFLSTTEVLDYILPPGFPPLGAMPSVRTLGNLDVFDFPEAGAEAHTNQGRVVLPNLIAGTLRDQAPPWRAWWPVAAATAALAALWWWLHE